MTWEEFQIKALEQGLGHTDIIDAIEMIGSRFDISYTTSDGYEGVIEIEE